MKKLFLQILVTLMTMHSFAQVSGFRPSRSEQDYSRFITSTKDKTYALYNVSFEPYYTAVQIQVVINNQREGSIVFNNNSHIIGEWGGEYPIGLYLNDKEWTFGKRFRYDAFNKGNSLVFTLLYPRIPAGVSTFSFRSDEIVWVDIPINNPNPALKSNWTESGLKSYWKSNGFDKVEGIYTFTNCSNIKWWGDVKHTLGIVKDDEGEYDVIYLKGSNEHVWVEGEVKGHFMSTAVKGLYKVTRWLNEAKMDNTNFYIQFNDQTFSIYESDKDITADFLKLFPNAEMIESAQHPHSRTASNSSEEQSVKGSGSGIIVSRNGIIATNYHVVRDATKIEVWVNHNDRVECYPAKILCSDKMNDLALLQVESTLLYPFENVPFTIQAKGVDVGTSVYTMGYPVVDIMGQEVKVTDGIISSKTGYEGNISTYQISAPIQPGNSGGPLFDKTGNLIGITHGGIRDGENIGYAIKSSYLLNLIESAPVKIEIPDENQLRTMDLPEQIRNLSKYVVCIKIK